MTKYFAYGSNMDPQRMAQRIPFTTREWACLPCFALAFDKQAQGNPGQGFANINCAPHDSVEGVLYEVLEEGLDTLDRREGVPRHYSRILVKVQTAGEIHLAHTYIAHPGKIAKGLKPTRQYLNHLLAGKDLLSPEYLHKLERVATLENEP